MAPFLSIRALTFSGAAIAATVATWARAADPQPATGALTVRVSRLRSNDGQVGCALYDSPKGFPTDSTAARQRRWCPINKGASSCAFDPIPAGTYAVACFHDENKNGKLDTGLFGIPTEGTVVSNHAKGVLGPPSFDKAKFVFSGSATNLDLHISN